MDPNNNPFNTQNSSNYPSNYPNPNNYQFQNQSSSQPPHISNYGYPPNFYMPSTVPNYPPYYGSMMQYSSQPPPYSSTPPANAFVSNVGTTEYPKFSTQRDHGDMSDVHEATPNADAAIPSRRKSPKWTTKQNLVLLSGWTKYGTDSIVGRNQKGEAFWGKIAEYCNDHCSFDHPRDGNSCRNHYNYVNKILGKWVSAYDNAKRMQQSGWAENDLLAKAHELYSGDGNGSFNLMKEWLAVRDQPRYGSPVRVTTGSGSSGSKRAHESDPCDSNSVGSKARPMGRDASKKNAKKKGKGATSEVVNEDFNQYKQLKAQEFEHLEKIAMLQEEANLRQKEATQKQDEANEVIKEQTRAKKMKMWMKLCEKDYLNDQSREMLQQLSQDLFGN